MVIATFENEAHGLFSDPPWMKVFKTTYDSLYDHLIKVLLSISILGMGVRLASALSSGFLFCIVSDIQSEDPDAPIRLGHIEGQYITTLTTSAAHDPECHDQVVAPRFARLDESWAKDFYWHILMKYPSFLMILELLHLLHLEKIVLILFPRYRQNLHRFYKVEVEEALLGKDPDVEEDIQVNKLTLEKVTRQRQRLEVSETIRNSSFMFYNYMGKKFVEICFIFVALFFNSALLWSYGFDADDTPGECKIELLINPTTNASTLASSGTSYRRPGHSRDIPLTVWMQCKEKRHDFFLILLILFTLMMCALCLVNLLALLWGCRKITLPGLKRKVTSMIEDIKSIEEEKTMLFGNIQFHHLLHSDSKEGQMEEKLGEAIGKDFLFLFDLIAENFGKTATLRVLSFADPSFHALCKPYLQEETMEKTESSVFLRWEPDQFRRLLLRDAETNRAKESFEADSITLKMDWNYVATIRPGNHEPKTLKLNWAGEVKFDELEGGTQRYTLTISELIKNSKMKGASVSFHLPPYPPQNLLCKSEDGLLKLSWTKPRKGDIYRYRVRISLLKQEELLPAETGTKKKEVVFKNDQNPLNDIDESGKTKISENTASFGFKRKQSSVRRRKDPAGVLLKGSPFTQRKELREADDSIRESEVKETWLDVDVEKHEEKDLLPGETYKVSLSSMTSDTQGCLKPLSRFYLTKPNPAGNLRVTEEELGSWLVSWSPPPPPGHSCLAGYRVEVRKADQDPSTQPLVVKRAIKSVESLRLNASELGPVSECRLSLFVEASRDVSAYEQSTGSEILPYIKILKATSPPTEANFTFSPLAPTNLRLESATHSSLKVKWDPPATQGERAVQSYIVTTKLLSSSPEDNKIFDEVKVAGTIATITKLEPGRTFLVAVAAIVNFEGTPINSKDSKPIEATTKPLPPTNLEILTISPKFRLRWTKSPTTRVTSYELTIRSEDDFSTYTVDAADKTDKTVKFLAPMDMKAETDYKINVYSLLELGGATIRSDPLHLRLNNGEMSKWSKAQLAAKRKTMSMSDLVIKVVEKQSWKSSTDLDKP